MRGRHPHPTTSKQANKTTRSLSPHQSSRIWGYTRVASASYHLKAHTLKCQGISHLPFNKVSSTSLRCTLHRHPSIASSYTNTNSYAQNNPCGCATMHTPQHQPTPSLIQAHTMQERRKLKAKEGGKKYHMQIGKFSYHLARKGKKLTRKQCSEKKGEVLGSNPRPAGVQAAILPLC